MLKNILITAIAMASLSAFAAPLQGHTAAKSCCKPGAKCCASHDKCCAAHTAKKPAMMACCTKKEKCCTPKKGAKPMACCAAHTTHSSHSTHKHAK